jgi:hypothetical protein
MKLQDKPSPERQDCDPVRSLQEAGLKSSLLAWAPHQPSSIEVHSAGSTPAWEGCPLPPAMGALSDPRTVEYLLSRSVISASCMTATVSPLASRRASPRRRR